MKAWLAALALALCPTAAWAAPVHHELTVSLVPEKGFIGVTDRITLPPDLPREADGSLRFVLHGGLSIDAATPGVEREGGIEPDDVPTARYRLAAPPGERTAELHYAGVIHHPVSPRTGDTPGIVSPEGVLLSGASLWVPRFADGEMVTFSLTVAYPEGWDVVSQGGRTEGRRGDHVTWTCDRPQDEIYLVAGPWTEYDLTGGPAVAQVYLREPDEALADRYLSATSRYLKLYQGLIGPYPYPKFALLENAWETGWGMPSFTLMGPQVIRMPFIVDTSYPHEILHNWWGNGVFVDEDSGNWSEGLTSYLADHLLQEQHGKGEAYRREALQKYADFARAGRDFPLTAFRARFDQASQAVGYGKAMMFFHMLRVQLGDEMFRDGLREFYRARRFQRAGYADLRAAFERVSGRDLETEFRQWTERTGAPDLAVEEVHARPEAGRYLLSFTLVQRQTEAPYILYVPVAVTMAGGAEALLRTVKTEGRRREVTLSLPARPLRLDVDPRFEVFRRLAPGETPPALSGLFGAEEAVFVLPARAPEVLMDAYADLAHAWGGENARIVPDTALSTLPVTGAVWVLGWDNAFSPQAMKAAPGGGLLLSDAGLVLPEGTYPRPSHHVALAADDATRNGAPIGWIATDDPAALAGLARKLPHYSKYGYLVFEGAAPDNVLKGQWPVTASELSVPVGPGKALPKAARIPPREPLAKPDD